MLNILMLNHQNRESLETEFLSWNHCYLAGYNIQGVWAGEDKLVCFSDNLVDSALSLGFGAVKKIVTHCVVVFSYCCCGVCFG